LSSSSLLAAPDPCKLLLLLLQEEEEDYTVTPSSVSADVHARSPYGYYKYKITI